MRRHFSLGRLAIVVLWAALSPQCPLLVHSWTGLLPGATVSDAAGVVPEFAGSSNRSSDRPGTVASITCPTGLDDRFAERDWANIAFPATDGPAASKSSSSRQLEVRRVPEIQGVVMR